MVLYAARLYEFLKANEPRPVIKFARPVKAKNNRNKKAEIQTKEQGMKNLFPNSGMPNKRVNALMGN